MAQDEHGNYVMTVDKDNIARETRVVIGNTMEDKQIVKDGLKPEDRVDHPRPGKIRNGQKVTVGEIKTGEDK